MSADSKILQTHKKLGEWPVGKLLFNMSLPPMISMIINALYNVIDSIFVAKISEDALSAVTLVFPVQMLTMAVLVGQGVGITSLISRRLGEHDQHAANNAADTGFFLSFVTWIVFTIFAVFFATPFIKLFTTNEAIVTQAVIYLRIVTIGSIFISISVTIERILQATGNMLYPMIFNGTAAVLNAVLAPLLIIGIGPFPRLEVMGAGIVAIFGQGVGMIIAVVLFVTKDHAVKINLRDFKLQKKTIVDIYVVALPTIIMMSCNSFMVGCMNKILLLASETAVAVLGVYFRIQSLIFMPVFGLNQGSLPIIGYNFGAKNRKRLMGAYKRAGLVAVIIMGIGTIVFWLFSGQIMDIFSAGEKMKGIGEVALKEMSISFVMAAFSIITVGLFQALGHGILGLIISFMRQLIILVPVAYILIVLFNEYVVWLAFPFAELFCFALSLFFLKRTYKKEIKPLGE